MLANHELLSAGHEQAQLDGRVLCEVRYLAECQLGGEPGAFNAELRHCL